MTSFAWPLVDFAARFLDRVFDGAAGELVMSLLRSERIPSEELERMQAMINEARRKRSARSSRT